jgi:hypothetical protein
MDFWTFAQQAQIPGMVKPPELQALINHQLGTTMKSGAEIIAAERERQKQVEGYNEQDAEYTNAQLLLAASAYLTLASGDKILAAYTWPWPQEYFRPNDVPVRSLAKAGALIAAEIDRLQAAASSND